MLPDWNKVVVDFGDWVIRVFRWINTGDTGDAGIGAAPFFILLGGTPFATFVFALLILSLVEVLGTLGPKSELELSEVDGEASTDFEGCSGDVNTSDDGGGGGISLRFLTSW